MRMAQDFAAARPAAQHCAELLGHASARAARPEERAALVAAWRRDLARLLAEELSALLAGDRLSVAVGAPEPISGAEVLARIGPVAANCLLRCGAGGERVLLSCDLVTAVALTERSFGGAGRPASGAPEALPRSAALLVEEAAAIIAGVLARTSLGDTPPPEAAAAATGAVMVRSESAARLRPFDPHGACFGVSLTITNQEGCTWPLLLACDAAAFARLLPGSRSLARPAARRRQAAALGEPFASIPLSLSVVLAELDLPLARLEALAPGDCLPLALGRQVPLRLGEMVLGHGEVGTSAERMAINLTRMATPGAPPPPAASGRPPFAPPPAPPAPTPGLDATALSLADEGLAR